MRGIAHLKLGEDQKAFDSFHLATLNDETYKPAFHQAAEASKRLGQPGLSEQYEKRAKE